MQRCPIEGCGRMFQNQLTMIEHVKRRHPEESQSIKQKTMNQMLQKQNKINEQMNKLPKMQRIIQMSKQKKTLQFQRRSSSKKRKQLVNFIQNSQIKLNGIITESRQLVDQNNTNSRKLIKRPSLCKKNLQQTDNKLPTLNQIKPKKLKLQNLKSQLNHSTINKESIIPSKINEQLSQNQNHMYSTAPNFAQQMTKKLSLLRSRSKGKEKQLQNENSNGSSSKDLSSIQAKDVLHRKTISSHSKLLIGQKTFTAANQKGMQQKQKPIQRPIKKLLERSSIKKQKQTVTLVSQPLSESMYIQKSPQLQQSTKQKESTFSSIKQSQNNRFIKKQGPLNSPSSYCSNLDEWRQNTVTIRNKNIQFLSIPDQAEVQYLFVTNCQIKQIDLNQCFSLVQLSLNSNKIENFQFLQETIKGRYQNVQSLYLDNNSIKSLSSLPTYLNLKRISLTFNNVSGIQQTIKILAKFPLLQEIDFSFNPIRKQTNYKLSVLSVCRNLKKLDGMKITKFDRQLADQYNKVYYQNLNIIPLSGSKTNSSIYDDKFRPSTAVSMNYQKDLQNSDLLEWDLTQQQLQKQIEMLQKIIKNTKQQFGIIKQQNQALQEQIQNNQPNLEQQLQKQQYNPKVYKKLCKQCQELQLLNFFIYASQKELQDLLIKKAKQKGIPLQGIVAN